MYKSHRNLILIATICITILGLVAGYNIVSRERTPNITKLVINDSVPVSLQPDAAFYQNVSDVISDIESLVTNVTGKKFAKNVPSNILPSDGISARAYIAGNLLTDRIYLSRNVDQVLPVASMSKLVTAFAATDQLSSTTAINITKAETDVPRDGSGITENETYTLKEILYPLLLDSSNVAAEAMASTTDRRNFLKLMSSYAWEIGMSTAYFADPSGVSPHNAASANDLFALAKYLYDYRSDILALTRTASTSIAATTLHGAHDFVSTHPFVTSPDFIGGKTGRTPEAGDTMLTIMNIDNQPIAIVVLGSRYDWRATDTQKIIDKVRNTIIR